MLKIGLTGGMGSGKSLVAKVFTEMYHIPVFYADHEAKKLMNTNDDLRKEIIALLGPQSYDINGHLNKTLIAKKIFNNSELRNELNKKVHKKVRAHFEKWLTHQEGNYILHEAAIMIESGSYKQMNQLINVQANEETRMKRIMKRDNLSKEQILQRLKAQLTDEERNKYSDYTIINDNKNSVISQVKNIHLKIMAHG